MSIALILVAMLGLNAILTAAVLVFWYRADCRAVRAEADMKARWKHEDARSDSLRELFRQEQGREAMTSPKDEATRAGGER